MNYFQNLRIEWANEMLSVYGYVGPVHMKRKFGISSAQASKDFRILSEGNKGIYYDVSQKAYAVTQF